MSHSTEKWLPVVGYEGFYEVSDHGQVRSVDRVIMRSNGSPQTWVGRAIPQSKTQSGHLRVGLNRGGIKTTRLVHQLVLEAFVGPCPEGMVTCHYDDDPTNNHVSNLRWDTRAANSQDLVRNGRHYQQRKTHCPRGHILDHPNLVVSNLVYGRSCLACFRAHSLAHSRNSPFSKSAADTYYAKIMAGKEAQS